MFTVDTNVLLYAAVQQFREHEPCRALVEQWRHGSDAWYLTPTVLYEFVRVVTHPRVFDRPWPVTSAWSFVDALLAAPGLGLLTETHRHADIARAVWNELPDLSGNMIHDAHIAILMREHGIRQIYTRDTGFHRFSFLRVVDPLKA